MCIFSSCSFRLFTHYLMTQNRKHLWRTWRIMSQFWRAERATAHREQISRAAAEDDSKTSDSSTPPLEEGLRRDEWWNLGESCVLQSLRQPLPFESKSHKMTQQCIQVFGTYYFGEQCEWEEAAASDDCGREIDCWRSSVEQLSVWGIGKPVLKVFRFASVLRRQLLYIASIVQL